MKTTFVISDIHGCLYEFEKLLFNIGYDSKTHNLILLGDYVDRGSRSRQVVEKVMRLVRDGAIAIRGNHDQMFIDFIDSLDSLGLSNGAMETLTNYIDGDIRDWDDIKIARDHIIDNYSEHIDFLRSLPYYYETDKHLFVHAGIDPFLNDWKNMIEEDMMWIRDQFIFNDHDLNKTVVVGHTPTVNVHKSADIWFGNKKILIDGGACFGYQLNCLQIDEDEEGNVIYTTHSYSRKQDYAS